MWKVKLDFFTDKMHSMFALTVTKLKVKNYNTIFKFIVHVYCAVAVCRISYVHNCHQEA